MHWQYDSGFQGQRSQKDLQAPATRRLLPEIQQIALRKLRMLNRAQTIQDLRVPPANRLERLLGDRAGQYRIRINSQWRVRFRFEDGDAFDVAMEQATC